MSNSAEVNVYIRNKNFRIYYSYNNKATFLDLLEYISFLFPELGICQCFEFEANNNISYNYQINYNNYNKRIKFEKNFLISRYSGYLSNLELIKTEKKQCHDCNNSLDSGSVTSFFGKKYCKNCYVYDCADGIWNFKIDKI